MQGPTENLPLFAEARVGRGSPGPSSATDSCLIGQQGPNHETTLSTHLSEHFRERRLALELRQGEVARRLGYKSIVGGANKIVRFEQTGEIDHKLLLRLAEVLGIDQATIAALIEQDRREFFDAWNEWANQPIRPHLIEKVIPAVFAKRDIPDEILGDTEAMERYASASAKKHKKLTFLILSRRLSISFNEDGTKRFVNEARPGEPAGPYMRLAKGRTAFLFDSNFKPRPLDTPTKPEINRTLEQPER